MGDKNLPIKIIQKRVHVDDRETEGGGSGIPPKWVLTGIDLEAKSINLLNDFIGIRKNLEEKLGKHDVPTVLKAKIGDLALAKSHRGDIVQALVGKSNEKILGVSPDQELLVRVDNISDLDLIDKQLHNFHRNTKAISGIDAIKGFEPYFGIFKPRENGQFVLKVKLIDFNNYIVNIKTRDLFFGILGNLSGLSLENSTKYSDNLLVYKIVADSIESINDLSEFNGLLSVESMPRYGVDTDDFLPDEKVEPFLPIDGEEYPVVGILDTGIAPILELRPWIIGTYSCYPEEYVNRKHGTFVAGIVCYGDILQGLQLTGVNGCKLFDAVVMPDKSKEKIDEDELVGNIRTVIEKFGHQIKIWNMSLGTKKEINDSNFSDFAVALDDIQDDNGVLIIKSAGNCLNFITGKSKSKIAEGAEAVRALTVGSIAHSKEMHDLVDCHYPSPFTRVGPGPAFIVKPEVVHYGGNCGVVGGKLIKNGVSSFARDGQVSRDAGTSFSTPRVSNVVAGLYNKMGEDFDALLLKTLVIHSSRYHSTVDMSMGEKLSQMGFGVPSLVKDILYNDPHEITLIIRDMLPKGEFIEILEFPYPSSLVDEDGFFNGLLTVTLVSHPVVANGQGPEYCQSNLEIMIGTYDDKVARDTTKTIIKNPIGRDGGQNLLNAGLYSRKQPSMKNQQFHREKTLIQYGAKYYPNKKYAVDLSQATSANKAEYFKSPKKWYLKIEGVYRNYIEALAITNQMDLAQEFCVVITIRDPDGQKDVYTETTQLLDVNNFIHRNIRVRQNVSIDTSAGGS